MTRSRLIVMCGSAGLLAAVAVLIILTTTLGNKPASGDHWLADEHARRRDQLERHLRGLDVAMIEIGYRFEQLHVAGEDGNWPYARYQIEKIEAALRLALERRPKRTESARPFLDDTIPFVQQAIDQASSDGDGTGYRSALERLRSDCMMCHVREQVPYMPVGMNAMRLTEQGGF
jgi:hypothetical protein